VDADPFSLVGGKALDHQTVQVDKTFQKSPRRVQFDRKPPFGEVYLNHMRAFLQAAAKQSSGDPATASNRQTMVRHLMSRLQRARGG